jgi:hypothetical protein
MATRLAVPCRGWPIIVLIAVVCLNLLTQVQPAAAQGTRVRLGTARVDWYCLQRGYSAWIINNGTTWACTASNGRVVLVLRQADLNSVCRGFYRNTSAYAVRDLKTFYPAQGWSCYSPVRYPPRIPPSQQAIRLGEFQVEWYCNERGFGVRLINNQTDWACTYVGSNQIAFVLGQQDFNTICQRTYGKPGAYALRDLNKPQPAYNWSCYVNVVVPRPPTTQLVRLGEFQVEWYCNERGLGVQLINNQTDWACTHAATGQIVSVLNQADFDQICRRTYNIQTAFAIRDLNKPQPAYNWSCYVNR